MQIPTSTPSARSGRVWWLVCAFVFAMTAAVQVYLAVTMSAWWAWGTAAVLVAVAVICVIAAQRRL